jgi:hypothetical protein
VSIRKNKVAKRASPTEVLDHWPKLIERLQYSPQEFYAKIEQALAERKVPDPKFNRVDWPEGGILSDRREYLRISRERLIFDICGAPFGSGFFVSIWMGEKPLRLGLLVVCFLLVAGLTVVNAMLPASLGIYRIMWAQFGMEPQATNLSLLGVLAGLVVLMLIKVGPNPDAFLLGLPIVGYFYERYFRKITYYRIDRMCMYQQAVNAAVMQVIEEITSAQCIKPVSDLERRPVLRDVLHRQGSNARL